MSFHLVFRRVAAREFEDATFHYGEKSVDLGIEFVAAITDTLDRIADNPYAYAIEHNKIRAATTPRFPYIIYFRVDCRQVIVLGVVHGARDPAIWKDRS
jgi:plasmid stabilization system protein ParE